MSANVLYVDDDRSLCQIVSKALQSEGYAVRTLHDGDEALASLREDVPDLVLLDVLLPRRDGFELLEEIRGLDSPAREVPVVVVTGCSPTPAYAQRANQLNAVDLLSKPVPLETLLDVVARHTGEAKRPVPLDPGPRSAVQRREAAGSFERIPFPAVLHHLHGLRATGVLHLASGKRRKWIQMRDGYPVAVRSNLIRETLGHHLVRSGHIAEAVLEESRQEMQREGLRQGEILVAMDVLSEEQVAEALREQADQKLFEVFGWNAGSFRFERGSTLQRANTLGLGRSPANLILEGVRTHFSIERVDRYLESHRGRYVAHGESPFYRFQDLQVDPADEGLLRGIDGTQRLEAFRVEDERLRRTVYGLLAAGLLELRSDARPTSRTAASEPAPNRVTAASTPLDERVAPSAQVRDRRRDDPRQLELLSMAEQLRERDPFEVLGVARTSSEAEQREAYERLSARTHPDHFSNASQAVHELSAEVFAMVRDAFETLSDPRSRQLLELDRKKAERREGERQRSQRAFEAETEFRKGEDALTTRSYETALAHFGKALELFPEEGDYHAHYGWSLYLSYPAEPSIVGEALEHVKRGLKLASHREKPYLFMGRLYKAIGRADTAEKMFMRAIQIQPECLEALRELRLIQMRREKSKGFMGRLLRR